MENLKNQERCGHQWTDCDYYDDTTGKFVQCRICGVSMPKDMLPPGTVLWPPKPPVYAERRVPDPSYFPEPPGAEVDVPHEAIHLTSPDASINSEFMRAVQTLIKYTGDDPYRHGLIETPKRVLYAFRELFDGYNLDPQDVFKVFDEDDYNGLVILRNIEFHSMCEHHILPFIGLAHVAYIATDNKVIGASKMARLVDIFAHRLATQERIANQVTDALMKHLKPFGAACIIEGVHQCMQCRGVKKQSSEMVTSSIRGVFKHSDASRQEMLTLMLRRLP